MTPEAGKLIYQPINNTDFFLRLGKPTIKESWQNADSNYIVYHQSKNSYFH